MFYGMELIAWRNTVVNAKNQSIDCCKPFFASSEKSAKEPEQMNDFTASAEALLPSD